MRGLRRGNAFFLFRRKERTKEKSFAFGLSYEGFAGFGLFLEGLFLGEVLLLPFAAGAALEPAAFTCFWGAPLTLRLLSFAFRDSANGGYLQSSFSPAPCSPLRRLRAYSAELVRAPPYIKVERENCPPDAIGRYSHRCIGRAGHKLKRARQLHRIYPASVFALSTLGERRLSTRGGMRCCRGIPYSAFRISNSAFPLPFSTKKAGRRRPVFFA